MKKLLIIAVLLIGVSAFAQQTVTSPTGEVWMDRNLGADRVAQSMDDEAAYGDLYQYGRQADGHEKRDSKKQYGVVSDWDMLLGKWIVGDYDNYYSWLEKKQKNPKNYWLWKKHRGLLNNPCPDGFRVPTKREWKKEMDTWPSQDAIGAYESVLKIPQAGGRSVGGKVTNGKYIAFWTATTFEYKRGYPYYLQVREETYNTKFYGTNAGSGMSVRCIKD